MTKHLASYKAYLFDWDGTLSMSHDAALAAVRKQLRRYKVDYTDMQIVDRIFGNYSAGMMAAGVPERDMPLLKAEIHADLKAAVPYAELYPQAAQVLRDIKTAGHKLALITSSFREVVDIALTNHELLEVFDVTVAGDEVKNHKPSPEGLLLVLEKFGVRPEDAVMIGDSRKDIVAGQNAGTDTLLFYPPSHETQHDLKELQGLHPTHVVRSWQEFLDQLQ